MSIKEKGEIMDENQKDAQIIQTFIDETQLLIKDANDVQANLEQESTASLRFREAIRRLVDAALTFEEALQEFNLAHNIGDRQT